MKNIIKALSETDFKPRKKWWGFVQDGKRFLCRYHHIMCVFEDNKPVFTFFETRTDKTGVMFAINHISNERNKLCNNGNTANTGRDYFTKSDVIGTR